MRCVLPLLSLIALAATAQSAYAQPTHAPPPPRAALESCRTSPLPIERIASFVASMPARAGAVRMRLRFDLERRRPGERSWTRVRAPGLGAWERSDANVAGFVFRKRVDGLWVPASYRARVRFQWIASDGSTLARAQARTRPCAQPDLRPNLVPGALTAILDAQPGLAIYTLVVHNSGRSAASAFSVRVGSAIAEVDSLQAGARRTVTVIAPACRPGETISVRVDSDRRVEESVERDNATHRGCPPALG